MSAPSATYQHALTPIEQECAIEIVRSIGRAQQRLARIIPLTRARDPRGAEVLLPLVERFAALAVEIDMSMEAVGLSPRQHEERRRAAQELWLEERGVDR